MLYEKLHIFLKKNRNKSLSLSIVSDYRTNSSLLHLLYKCNYRRFDNLIRDFQL